MANPNIINVSDIRGKTAVSQVSTTATAIVTNNNSSNKIFKINSLIASNVTSSNHQITVELFRSSVARRIAHQIIVPSNASLIVISKDSGIYLEEGDSLRVLSNTNNNLEVVCSYEEIS